MKIRALRLAEVGPFRDPVALEGFSGGFDVFTGPNEVGKSTLFTALGMLLAERHTTTARGIAALRPDAGGTPLIEADIDAGGRRLRLTKRFLAQRMASLEDLGSGQIWHGGDAETAADQFLGGEERRALRTLLWVAQGASFGLPDKPDAALSAGLASVIEQEAADASGAGYVRRLANVVRVRLEEFVTVKQGRAKAGGPLDKARRQYDEIAQRLGVHRAKAAAAEGRLARWTELAAERVRTFDTRVVEGLAAEAAAARKAVEDADRAREMLRFASERLAGRQLARDQVKLELERFQRACVEVERLERALVDGRAKLVDLGDAKTEKAELLQRLLGGLASAEAALAEARGELWFAHAANSRLAASRQVAEIDHRLAQAREAAAALASAKERLSHCLVREAGVEAARRLSSRISALDERIAAETTRATVVYEPGVRARIRLAGVEIPDGGSVSIDQRAELVIEGVGTIVLEPGTSIGASPAVDRERCVRELADLLAGMGVDDANAAQEALTARRHDEAAVAEATSKLGVLAPAGLSALEAARAAAQAVVDENAHASGREAGDVAALDVNVKGLEQSLASHRDAVAAAERELGLLDASIARLEAQVGSDQKQLAALAEGLPGPDDRRAAGETLAEADVTSAKELAEAVREKSAWSEAAPQGSAYEALLASSRRAASAVTELADRQAKLDRDVAELEGALRRDSEDGVGAEIAGLEEELAVAARRLEELQRDADALQLLASRLERFGEDHRDRVLRPLVDRLEPLLSKLIPDAKLAMDGPLLAVRLDRPGLTDPVQRVSGGTREQIATLVRIAHADLMASRGVELPLVLDDALVFSDDRRLEIMVGLLAEAAKRHQVIVLSCHQRALDPLFAACGANRLEMSAWGEVKAVGSRSEGGRGDPRSQKSRAVGPAFEITQ